MHNPRKIVKVSPVLFTSVSQTFDDFCRQKCFTSPCLAKNKQVMATQSKLVCLKLVFVHFSSVIYGFTRLHMWFLKYSGKNIRSASGPPIAGNPFTKIPGLPLPHLRPTRCSLTQKRSCPATPGETSWKRSTHRPKLEHGQPGKCLRNSLTRQCHTQTRQKGQKTLGPPNQGERHGAKHENGVAYPLSYTVSVEKLWTQNTRIIHDV